MTKAADEIDLDGTFDLLAKVMIATMDEAQRLKAHKALEAAIAKGGNPANKRDDAAAHRARKFLSLLPGS